MTPYANLQSLFDVVAPHLLSQMKRSGVEKEPGKPASFTCTYRSEGGAMCAIGAAIPDELWTGRDNTLTIGSIIRKGGRIATLFENISPYALSELQGIHDTNLPYLWREKLEAFAKDHSLSTSCIE